MSDRISLVNIHSQANLVSFEQCRSIQVLLLLYSHGKLNPQVLAPPCNPRAANRLKYWIQTEKYENGKYKNSPFYKAAKLWDTLPKYIVDTGTLTELKKHLKAYYSPSDDKYFETEISLH